MHKEIKKKGILILKFVNQFFYKNLENSIINTFSSFFLESVGIDA